LFTGLALALALAGGGGFMAWRAHHSTRSLFRTAVVKQGDLVATITATGTVEPEEVVDVGAQVSGQFLEFGKDGNGNRIDYRSVVESNMLLARIDPRLYKAAVDLDHATLNSDKAGEAQAAANVEQMIAKEAQAEADWKRAQVLGPSEALAPTTYDSYKAAYETAKANLAMARASAESAKAATQQAEANLEKDQYNLDQCTIKSPVKGEIIDRRVTIGETVASSLNTPSLFLIAKDLTRMQVWASVNEADIGNIHPGQAVTFTVDALPNRVFHGLVNKVRFNATMTQNVVTYTVEVNTDNSDRTLIPYLTANVNFLAGQATNVLLVLNSALRWHPQNDLIAPEFRKPRSGAGEAPEWARGSGGRGAPAEVAGGAGGSSQPGGTNATAAPDAPPVQMGTLWAADGIYVRPVPVKLGLTDGTWTQVQGENLTKGTVVVTGILSAEAAADESAPGANPFVPQIGQRRGPANAVPTRRSGGAGS
jgi:HlyD family secretion protein